MFKKLIFNKTLIFILVFTMLFNFITIPKKVSAEAITMSYGLYVFLQAAYAAGLTYIVADRVTEDGIKLYQEWQKFNENKPEKPDDNDQRNAIANLLGLGLLDSFGNLVDSVKDFFKSLGAKEGDNTYREMDRPTNLNIFGYDISVTRTNYDGSYSHIWYFRVNGSNIYYDPHMSMNNQGRINSIYSKSGSLYADLQFSSDGRGGDYYMNKVTKRIGILPSSVSDDFELKPDDGFLNYNIADNSYILTDDKKDIIDVYPNIDIIPKEKFETISTPDGYYQKYIGDDLVDDYIESIPNNFPGNLFESKPGSIVETDYGTIWVPEGSPIPSPNPNPDPKPEYPDTFPTDPYPEIVEEDVEIPKGLGKIIALLKELINWSSRIFNKEEIDKDLEPDKPGLFEIPDNLNLDLDPLKNLAIIEKFPFSLPWDLKNAVNLLVSPAEPPKWTVPIVSEEIEIDLSEFESLAFISRSFFTILFIIALVIATRRFIGGA